APRRRAGRESTRASVPEGRFLSWKRAARALVDADFASMDVWLARIDTGKEVQAAALDATKEVVAAIRTLRRNPRDEEARNAFAALGLLPLQSVAELETWLGKLPVFYLDRSVSGDDRATAGLLSVPPGKWERWGEVAALDELAIAGHEKSVQQSTLVILAGSVLILLLLGGPSGGTPAAWWLAVFLAGTHFGWVSGSLDLILDRVRFQI